MAVAEGTVSVLRELVELLLVSQAPTEIDGLAPVLVRGATENLRQKRGAEAVRLEGEQYVRYEEALAHLSEEPELEHLTRTDVDEHLWSLVCDVYAEPEEYAEADYRERAVLGVCERLAKRHEEYEALFPLDRLTLPEDQSFEMAGVRFERMSSEALAAWGYSDHEVFEALYEQLTTHPVARVTVRAGSAKAARERAARAVDAALGLFRLSFSEFRAAIRDEQLLQQRTDGYVLKRLPGPQHTARGWHRGFRGYGLELDATLLGEVNRIATRFRPVFNGTVAAQISSQFMRAIELVGASVTHEHADDKVVNLCTALEAILTMRQERDKSAAVALRLMLLSIRLDQPFSWPAEPYDLYQLRNRVIHGESRGVSTERDYRDLRRFAYDALVSAVELVISDRQITDMNRFVSAMEEHATMSRAIHWLKANEAYLPEQILAFALQRYRRVHGETPLGPAAWESPAEATSHVTSAR
jgi:hypothetical protein